MIHTKTSQTTSENPFSALQYTKCNNRHRYLRLCNENRRLTMFGHIPNSPSQNVYKQKNCYRVINKKNLFKCIKRIKNTFFLNSTTCCNICSQYQFVFLVERYGKFLQAHRRMCVRRKSWKSEKIILVNLCIWVVIWVYFDSIYNKLIGNSKFVEKSVAIVERFGAPRGCLELFFMFSLEEPRLASYHLFWSLSQLFR